MSRNCEPRRTRRWVRWIFNKLANLLSPSSSCFSSYLQYQKTCSLVSYLIFVNSNIHTSFPGRLILNWTYSWKKKWWKTSRFRPAENNDRKDKNSRVCVWSIRIWPSVERHTKVNQGGKSWKTHGWVVNKFNSNTLDDTFEFTTEPRS